MSIYDYTVTDAQGNPVSMQQYKGQVLLIVNTATGCGFTPQYQGLQELYDAYKAQGFEILDFPCNQFMGQAPGTDAEIVSFCQTRFGVTFKTFSKIKVNGQGTEPLFKFLKNETHSALGNAVKWNFTKFLVDRQGNVVARFAPNVEPKELKEEIEALIAGEQV